MDVDDTRQYSGPRCCLPLCGIPFRPFRPALHCHRRRRPRPSRHDHRLHGTNNEHRHWRTGICRCWCGHQRAHGARCRIRDCACLAARQIRGRIGLYHHTFLYFGAVRPAHCCLFVLEVHWAPVCPLEFHWPGYDRGFLLPSTPHRPRWTVEKGNCQAHGPGWRLFEYCWFDSIQ